MNGCERKERIRIGKRMSRKLKTKNEIWDGKVGKKKKEKNK
jgi:hypothetical protein